MSDKKTTAEITIGGEVREIKKLKAGAYFEAQKVFSKMLNDASKARDILKQKKDIADKIKDKDISNLNPEDINPDDINMDLAVDVMNSMPRQMAEFVAVCADMTHEELLETADPEELPEAFRVCFELNNVMENLKNFQSPMMVVGGKKTATPKKAKKEKKAE